jgi:dolichol-phosphate mannosyltransferase
MEMMVRAKAMGMKLEECLVTPLDHLNGLRESKLSGKEIVECLEGVFAFWLKDCVGKTRFLYVFMANRLIDG